MTEGNDAVQPTKNVFLKKKKKNSLAKIWANYYKLELPPTQDASHHQDYYIFNTVGFQLMEGLVAGNSL